MYQSVCEKLATVCRANLNESNANVLNLVRAKRVVVRAGMLGNGKALVFIEDDGTGFPVVGLKKGDRQACDRSCWR